MVIECKPLGAGGFHADPLGRNPGGSGPDRQDELKNKN